MSTSADPPANINPSASGAPTSCDQLSDGLDASLSLLQATSNGTHCEVSVEPRFTDDSSVSTAVRVFGILCVFVFCAMVCALVYNFYYRQEKAAREDKGDPLAGLMAADTEDSSVEGNPGADGGARRPRQDPEKAVGRGVSRKVRSGKPQTQTRRETADPAEQAALLGDAKATQSFTAPSMDPSSNTTR